MNTLQPSSGRAGPDESVLEFSEHSPVSTAATILLIEAQPCLCNVMATVLRRCGYRVLTACDAAQARALLRQGIAIDLVVASIEHPELCGPEAAAWINGLQPGAVLLFTAHTHPLRWPAAIHLVERPFVHLPDLVREVRAALRKRDAVPSIMAA